MCAMKSRHLQDKGLASTSAFRHTHFASKVWSWCPCWALRSILADWCSAGPLRRRSASGRIAAGALLDIHDDLTVYSPEGRYILYIYTLYIYTF